MIIYVMSDSVGDTGKKVVQSAVHQFPIGALEIRRFPFVRDIVAIDKVFEEFQNE